jgi:lysophospholipase L1-like esterase
MKNHLLRRALLICQLCALLLAAAPVASAQYWVSFDDNTRYMALGDSLSAGYGAKPATQGFVFRLYQMGVIDKINNMLFCAAGVPGAASVDVLNYQVPQVPLFFKETGLPYRKVVTLTVGGNDLLAVIEQGKDPAVVIGSYGQNLAKILGTLTARPDVQVYVGNLYDPKLPVPGAAQLIQAMNQTMVTVATNFPRVVIVDLYAAFQGRSGLLLSERPGSAPDQIHPTDAGYAVMARAFADAIGRK